MAHRTAVEFGPEMALSQGLLAPIGRIGNRLTDKAGPARQSEDGSLAGGCTSSMQMALKLKLALLAFATLRADAAGHGIWQRHRHHHQFGHPLELLLTTIRVVYSGGLAPDLFTRSVTACGQLGHRRGQGRL